MAVSMGLKLESLDIDIPRNKQAVTQSGQDDRWLQSVAEAAPNLRQLAMHGHNTTNFTSEGLIAFCRLAKKLTHFHIELYDTKVSEVAKAMGIYFVNDDLGNMVFPNYAQSMEDDWIGV
ncbi:hypothetical protein HK104_001728 [Borealophlyctis nickersoniae]|nr:hypothetical protein HK104_001728 [Borealophlyctis nickersoniae]